MSAEPSHLTHKGTQPHAIVGVESGNGRVGSGAITNAPIGDGEASVGNNGTPTGGSGAGDTCHIGSGDGRQTAGGGETDLLAVSCSGTITCIGSQIVGGTRFKTGDTAYKSPKPVPSVVWLLLMVGCIAVLQQTPLAVTGKPPSALT